MQARRVIPARPPEPPARTPRAVRAPEDETKRQKFERLATPRVNRALTSIRLLGNLASSNYDWAEDDVAAIRAALDLALDQALAKFETKTKADRPSFVLPSKQAERVNN